MLVMTLQRLQELLNVTDTTAPVITLVGDAQITVEVGTTYTDLGLQHQIIMMGILQLILLLVNNVDTSVGQLYSDL